MAETIREQLGVEARLVKGRLGEFSVWVGSRRVARKGWLSFPSEAGILKKVQAALAS